MLIENSIEEVAPFAGVWIEIWSWLSYQGYRYVAPFAGVWIEIYCGFLLSPGCFIVAPFAGVWIEIFLRGI